MPRKLALDVIDRVIHQDAYSHLALDAALSRSDLSARDKGLATELVYGTLTWLTALDLIIASAAKGGLRRVDDDVLAVLRLATYQLVFLDRIPPHAVLDEAARMTKKVQHRAVGFVNGVLRRIQRRQQDGDMTWWREEDRQKKPVRYLAQRYSLPTWIANRLWQMLGLEGAEEAARGLSSRPTTWARTDDPEVAESLSSAHPQIPHCYKLDGAITPAMRTQIADGKLQIQDLGSQLIGWMAAPSSDASPLAMLDACAGLGGKALHQLAISTQIARAVCVEPQASKLSLFRDAVAALNHDAQSETFEGDLAAYVEANPAASGSFDLVIVDAPCTGLGTMRRHPETRWRRTEADIASLVPIQRALLDLAADLVKPGGALLYSVCTFTREEGPKQVESFLTRDARFERAAPARAGSIDWATHLDDDQQLVTWPHSHDSDAFFAARMTRMP